jgi:hypothetical protein
MRCDQCRHWQRQSNTWEADDIGFGRCTVVRERWKIQDEASKEVEWDAPKEYDLRRKQALIAARAYVEDGNEYMALLFTGPDFFCALFAEAPP